MLTTEIEKINKYGLACAITSMLEKIGFLKLKYSDLCIQKYFLNLPVSQRERELEIWFKSETGNILNLTNPTTFNDKIQWLKLYDSTPIKTRLADKYSVREWVEEKIGGKYLIPIIGVWDAFEDIPFDKLPQEYVLKCTHGSGMNIIVRKDSPLDMKEAKVKIEFWMKSFYGIGPMQEWHYRDVPHRIIVEKYMETLAGEGDLYDYKFYCFNGTPRYCQVIKGRSTSSQMAFYNLDWSDALFSYIHFGKMKEPMKRPAQLEKAIEIAATLSQGFSFVRVDLYLVGERNIYFGEMTFTPASGVRHWLPEGTDEMLGSLLELPEEKYTLT